MTNQQQCSPGLELELARYGRDLLDVHRELLEALRAIDQLGAAAMSGRAVGLHMQVKVRALNAQARHLQTTVDTLRNQKRKP